MAETQRDPMLEQLADAIMQHLSGPAPTAPTPPQFTGLPPLKAAAAAMNPQFAPMLMQQHMAPAQAQFEQQKAAFEQAMLGRREALQAGTDIATAAMRPYSAANPRLQSKEFVITGSEAAKMGLDSSRGWRIRQTFNPSSGEYSEPEVLGETFVSPVVTPGNFGGQEGIGVVDRSGGGRGSATIVPNAAPKAAAGQVENISDLTGVMRKIDSLSGDPSIQVGDAGTTTARTFQEVLRKVPVIGPGLSGKANAGVEDTARTLDDIRSRVQLILTGKAAQQSEMNRLMGLIPSTIDATNPEFFFRQMDKFRAEFKNALTRQAKLHPELFLPGELQELGISGQVTAPPGTGTRKTAAQLADELGLK